MITIRMMMIKPTMPTPVPSAKTGRTAGVRIHLRS
jgi:hypothetical protein